MFDKCANPACDTCWGNSHAGRLFLSDSAPFRYTTRRLQMRVGIRHRTMHCYWLCDQCCQMWNIREAPARSSRTSSFVAAHAAA